MAAPALQVSDELRPIADKLRKSGATQRLQRALKPAAKAPENDHARFAALEYLVLQACADASAYVERHECKAGHEVGDQFTHRRRQDQKVLAELMAHAADVRKLISFVRRHRSYLGQALGEMHRVPGVNITVSPPAPVIDVWLKLFAAYGKGLKPVSIPAGRGPFVHRSRIGPLDLGEALGNKGGAFRISELGLVFQLALYFRRYTGTDVDGELLGWMQTGEPMPTCGKPCWGICATLVAATFGTPEQTADDLGRRFNKFLGERSGTTFVGWPA